MYDRFPFPRSSERLLTLLMAVLVAAGCGERSDLGPTEVERAAEPSFVTTSTEIAPGSRSFIFDGSTESGSVVDVVLRDGESQVGPATVGIPQLLLLHPAFNPDLQLLPAEPPTAPELEDDCGALANVEAVKAFLADAEQFLEGTAANVESCSAQVGALTEEILGLIESAEKADDIEQVRNPCSSVGGSMREREGGKRSFSIACTTCTSALNNTTFRLEALSRYSAQCNQMREDLEMLRERVLGELESGELSGETLCLAESGRLEEFARLAETLEEKSRSTAAEVASTIESGVCCEESLEVNCEACPSSDEPETLIEAVFEVPAGPAIDQIIGALNTAANLTDDDDEAATLKELAFRLEITPRNLARRVVYPADVPATEDLLAVRPSFAVDGRPPVFILSGVPEDLLPEPTILDEMRWFQETDAWRGIFTKGPVELF